VRDLLVVLLVACGSPPPPRVGPRPPPTPNIAVAQDDVERRSDLTVEVERVSVPSTGRSLVSRASANAQRASLAQSTRSATR